MWPFAKRGARASTPHAVASSPLDYAAFAHNGACIKIWLPGTLDQALNQLSVTHDDSKPDVLRGLLFEHVYGRQAMEGLIAWKRRQDAEARRSAQEPDSRGLLREPLVNYQVARPRIASIEMFGKATIAIKLWLPQRLKDDLDTLARQEQLDRSHYIRKALVRQLLGELRHQQWRAAIGDLPADIRQVEADDGV